MTPKRKTPLSPIEMNQPIQGSSDAEKMDTIPSSHRGKSFLNWLPFALLAAAIFLIFKGKVQLGEVLLVAFVLLQVMAKARFAGSFEGLSRWSESGFPAKLFWLLVVFWAGFSVELLTFPSHRWMLPKIGALPFQYSMGALLVFWVGMVAVLKVTPEISAVATDLSPRAARGWLLLMLVVNSFFVFYHGDTLLGDATEDTIVHTAVGHLIFDLKNYSGFFDAQIGNDWPPFASWLSILLWYLKPDIPVVLMARIVSGLVASAFIIFIYLAGKELANRRTGILAAGTASVSQALITKALAHMTGDSHTMTMALILWLFFRAVRNPKIHNFLLWGAALPLGLYCYLIFRPIIPFLVFSALVWIFIQRQEERKMEKPVLTLVISTAAIFFFYVFYTNYLFPFSNPLSRVISVSGSWLICLTLGFFLVFTFRNVRLFLTAIKQYPYMLGWAAGVWLCMILSFPKMWDQYELGQLVSREVAGDKPIMIKSLKSLAVLFDRNGEDSRNLNFPGDPIFGFLETIVGALGLAMAVARPNLKTFYLLVVFAVTASIYLLTNDTFSLRVTFSLAPLLLLGAFALDQLWTWFLQVMRSRVGKIAAFILVLGFWGWMGRGVFERVCIQWSRYVFVNSGVFQRALEDQKQGYQVYVGPGFTWTLINYVLYENHPVRILKPFNSIFVSPDEKPQDIIIYLLLTDPHQGDDDLREKIVKDFPNVRWETVRIPFDENEGPLSVKCRIPFSEISSVYDQKYRNGLEKYAKAQAGSAHLSKPPVLTPPSRPLFDIRRVVSPYWACRYFTRENGLRPGLIDLDVKTVRIDEPLPSSINLDQEVVQYKGTIHVGQDSLYVMTCKTSNRTKIRLDGMEIFDLSFPRAGRFNYSGPGKSKTKSTRLKAGNHQVEVLTWFQNSKSAPEVILHKAGTSGPGQSLWSSFDF